MNPFWRMLYLAFCFTVFAGVSWTRWSGYEFGDDAATAWQQQSATQYHK